MLHLERHTDDGPKRCGCVSSGNIVLVVMRYFLTDMETNQHRLPYPPHQHAMIGMSN